MRGSSSLFVLALLRHPTRTVQTGRSFSPSPFSSVKWLTVYARPGARVGISAVRQAKPGKGGKRVVAGNLSVEPCG